MRKIFIKYFAKNLKRDFFKTKGFAAHIKTFFSSKIVKYLSSAVMIASIIACSSMTRSQKGAAIGAASGGAIGYLITGGPLGTIGGAAVGGVVGAKR